MVLIQTLTVLTTQLEKTEKNLDGSQADCICTVVDKRKVSLDSWLLSG